MILNAIFPEELIVLHRDIVCFLKSPAQKLE
jgi:hypothetical protein